MNSLPSRRRQLTGRARSFIHPGHLTGSDESPKAILRASSSTYGRWYSSSLRSQRGETRATRPNGVCQPVIVPSLVSMVTCSTGPSPVCHSGYRPRRVRSGFVVGANLMSVGVDVNLNHSVEGCRGYGSEDARRRASSVMASSRRRSSFHSATHSGHRAHHFPRTRQPFVTRPRLPQPPHFMADIERLATSRRRGAPGSHPHRSPESAS